MKSRSAHTKRRSRVRSRHQSKRKSGRTVSKKIVFGITVLFIAFVVGIFSLLALARIVYVRLSAVPVEQTIVLAGSEVAKQDAVVIVAHLHPDASRSQITVVDAQGTTEIPLGYGTYPLQSVVPLGLLDNQPEWFFSATFSHAFERVIDHVYVIPGEVTVQTGTGLQKLLVSQMLSHGFTLKSHQELLQVHNAISKGNVRVVSLSEYRMRSRPMQIIASEIATACPVGILNSTSSSGEANSMTSILENSGLVVVRVGQETEEYDTSTLYVDPEKADECGEIITSVQKVFPVELVQVDDATIPQQYRASIVAVIGSDSVREED